MRELAGNKILCSTASFQVFFSKSIANLVILWWYLRMCSYQTAPVISFKKVFLLVKKKNSNWFRILRCVAGGDSVALVDVLPLVSPVVVMRWLNKLGRFTACLTIPPPAQDTPRVASPKRYFHLLWHISECGPWCYFCTSSAKNFWNC